jgi:phage baseplate assembly protein W
MTGLQDQYELGRLKRTAVYVDVSPSLGDGSREVVLDVDAVNAGLANLLSTPIGTCGPTFNPRYGGMLYEFLQETISEKTAGQMRTSIFQAIHTWERRVTLDMSACEVTPDWTITGYRIFLKYTLAGGLSGSLDLTVRAN